MSVSSDPISTTAADLRAFVGKNADYYLERWMPILKNGKGRAGFNWAAAFLSIGWLSFRKMYFIAMLALIIIFLESILEEFVFVGVYGKNVPSALNPIVGIIVGIVCGAKANRWYLNHAKRVILKTNSSGLDEESANAALAKKGGTSILSVVCLIVLLLISIFLASAVTIESEDAGVDTDVWSSEFTSTATTSDDIRVEIKITYNYQVINPEQNLLSLGGNGGFTDSALAAMVSSISNQLIDRRSLAKLKTDSVQTNQELERLMSEEARAFGVIISNVNLELID